MSPTFLFLAAAEAPAPGPAAQGNPMEGLFSTLVFIGLMFAVLYFLVLRPQKKKEKDRQALLSKVQKGDRVVTIGGLYGEVTTVKEKYVVLLVDRDRGVSLKFNRSAIHNILTKDSEEEDLK